MSNDFVYQIVADVIGVMVINRVEKKDAVALDMKFLTDAGLFIGASTLNERFIRMWMVQYVYLKLPDAYKSAGMVIGDLITVSAVKMILSKYVLGRMQALTFKELMYEVMVNFSIMSVSAETKVLMQAGVSMPSAPAGSTNSN